jgi:hypothetical protein
MHIPISISLAFACNDYLSMRTANILLLDIPENRTNTNRSLRESVQLTRKPILDSGNYRHRFTTTETKSIDPGRYVLIASTYHADQLGEFTITIDSSSDIAASPVA